MDGFIEALSIIWEWYLSHITSINTILAIVIVFFQRRDPKSTWGWLLLLYFIPVLGFFLYLVIGHNFHKNKMFRIKEVEDELNAEIKKQENIIFNNEFSISDERMTDYSDLVLYNLETSGSIYTENNWITIYTDGNDKFESMIKEMKEAKTFIHIQYYIISKGELFDRIFDVLKAKANEGIEVRVLYDSMGSRNIGKKNLRRMKEAGIKVGEFFPAFLGRFQFRFNYRNHRKIVVIDGNKAYIGGFNIGDEYIDKVEKFGHWRDTHFRISGEAVNDLSLRFILDWNYTTKENLFMDNKYFMLDKCTFGEKLGIQIVSSGPDTKRQAIRDNYLRLIHKAKERIYIQTPYFIPDEPVLEALKIASHSGIDVRLMIPCKPDHPFVYWTTYSYAGDLLSSGARCYCYDKGFLHAKGMIVDGLVSCYGTANMDMRSFSLDFEVNAVIYDAEVSCALEKMFLDDLMDCTEITKYNYDRRNLIVRIKEQVSRLLAPLM